jgi:hypothetical protein
MSRKSHIGIGKFIRVVWLPPFGEANKQPVCTRLAGYFRGPASEGYYSDDLRVRVAQPTAEEKILPDLASISKRRFVV